MIRKNDDSLFIIKEENGKKKMRTYNDVVLGFTLDYLEEELKKSEKELFKIALKNYLYDLENLPWKTMKGNPLYDLSVKYPLSKNIK